MPLYFSTYGGLIMSNIRRFRIVFWNIKHGGGSRAGKITEQILAWRPDIVALAEFRGTAPSRSIAQDLRAAGYVHQLTTVDAAEPAMERALSREST